MGLWPLPIWESRGTIPKEKLFSAPFCVETSTINQCLYKRTFKKQSTIPQLTPPKFDHTSQIQPQPFRWPVSLTLMTADLSTSLILKDTWRKKSSAPHNSGAWTVCGWRFQLVPKQSFSTWFIFQSRDNRWHCFETQSNHGDRTMYGVNMGKSARTKESKNLCVWHTNLKHPKTMTPKTWGLWLTGARVPQFDNPIPFKHPCKPWPSTGWNHIFGSIQWGCDVTHTVFGGMGWK